MVLAASILVFILIQNDCFSGTQHGVSAEPLPKAFRPQPAPEASLIDEAADDEALVRNKRSPDAEPRRFRAGSRYRYRYTPVRYRRGISAGSSSGSNTHLSTGLLLAIIFGSLAGTLLVTATVAYCCK